MANDARTVAQIRTALEARGLDASGLSPVGVRPSIPLYLQELWDRRHFLWMDSRHRVASQNSRNRLGKLWLLLRPLLDAAFYFLVFGLVLDIQGRVENYAAFLIIGILSFQAMSRTLTQGPNLMYNSRAMIRAFSFPRIAVPLSFQLREALQLVPTMLVMLVVIAVIPPFVTPTWTWFLMVPILALQLFVNLGISLILARFGSRFPDTTQVMGFISRVAMYASGVIFPLENFITHSTAAAVLSLNPLYRIIDMLREVLMEGTIPSAESWLIVLIWAAGLVLVGFVYFWRGEATYGGDE